MKVIEESKERSEANGLGIRWAAGPDALPPGQRAGRDNQTRGTPKHREALDGAEPLGAERGSLLP